MPEARSYAAGPTMLSIDQQDVGFVRSSEGGAIVADVIHEPLGATQFIKKHLGQTRYEDIVLGLPFGMSPRLSGWIADTWAMKQPRKDGSLTFCDYTLTAKSRLDFSGGLITEITIPGCDAASKEAAFLRLKVTPESLRLSKVSQTMRGGDVRSDKRSWIPSSFKLTIDDLDCSKVSKIEPFSVKQTILFEEIGESREMVKAPAQVEFPNLRITLSEAGAQTWLDWHEDFVVKGNNDDSQERDGRLSFLAPNMKEELAAVKLYNLGIFRIASDKAEASKEQIKRVTADLYCERMELEFPPSG
jgi:hypothetical protein